MKLIDMLVEDGLNGWRWPEGAEKATSYSHIPGVHFWDCDGLRVDYSDLTTRELGCKEVTREQYESALAAKNDGWIEWSGGKCPVQTGVLVDVRYGDGVEEFALEANTPNNTRFRTAAAAWWRKDGGYGDIIAYRLHQPQEAVHGEAGDKANLNECASNDAEHVWNGEGLPPVGIDVEYRFARVKYRVEFSRGKVIAYGSKNVFMEHWSSKNEFMQPLDKIEFRPLRTEADKKRDAAVMAINNTVDASGTLGSEIYEAIAAGKIPGVKLEGL